MEKTPYFPPTIRGTCARLYAQLPERGDGYGKENGYKRPDFEKFYQNTLRARRVFARKALQVGAL